MESKHYFGALLLNRHCTARLHREERRLDRQQKLMYNRVWKEKELLMDDYIQINVRTPSPQKLMTSSPAALLHHRRAKSCSAAELDKHNAPDVQDGSKESHSVLNHESLQCSKTSDPQFSESSAAAETSKGEIHLCSLENRMFPSLADVTPTTYVPAADVQVDFRPNLKDAVNCEKSDRVTTASDCSGRNTHSTTEASFTDPKNDMKQLPKTRTHTTSNETRYDNTFKYSSQSVESGMNEVRCVQEPASPTCDINSSDPCSSSTRSLKSHTWTTVQELPSALSNRYITTPHVPRSSSTLGCCRKESLDDSDFHRKQRPTTSASVGNTNRTKMDKWDSSTRKKGLQLQNKSEGNSRKKTSTSKHTALRQTDSEFDQQVSCHTDKQQENGIYVPNKRRNSLDKRAEQTKNHHNTDSRSHDQGTNQTRPNDSENERKNETTPHQVSVGKSRRPRAPKKLHVRQMTLDPKLVLPLSAKRYKCKKQATIIPVIAVHKHQATLYPNAEAKAGRVVMLDRKARGWMERSTSILFSLENRHSTTPKHRLLPSVVKATVNSPHTEHQHPPEQVIPPKPTSLHNDDKNALLLHDDKNTLLHNGDKNTHDAIAQNMTSSETSSANSLMSFLSQTVMSSSGDEDSSDVVLVPQTIYRDPESPLFKDRFSQTERARGQTVQRQRNQRAKPKTAFVSSA